MSDDIIERLAALEDEAQQQRETLIGELALLTTQVGLALACVDKYVDARIKTLNAITKETQL